MKFFIGYGMKQRAMVVGVAAALAVVLLVAANGRLSGKKGRIRPGLKRFFVFGFCYGPD